MRLGRAAVAAAMTLAARDQLGPLLPSNFCMPECPSCKDSIASPFDYAGSCVENSSFIVNCGSCQLCILTYSIEHPGQIQNMDLLQKDVAIVLGFCANTTVSAEIAALQSQASQVSQLGAKLTSGYAATAIASTTDGLVTLTRTGVSSTVTWTGTPNPSWTTILSTATWASAYYSMQSEESSASAAASRYNQTAGGEKPSNPTITPSPTAPTAVSENNSRTPLSKSWVIGPVLGSMLGLVTVFIVIYFTRRRQGRDTLAMEEAPKDIKEEDADDSGDSTQAKSQLPSESVELGELENTEVHELPAMEPVGSELNSPRDGTMAPIEEWPLPLSPLPLLFAMTELRDERTGNNISPKHETYYNA